MPGLYRDEGVVLKTIKLGEADRIVTLFTRGHGKVRAVAKGIRKTKSRFGARLEPFTHVELLIYRGRNLDVITQADIVDSFRAMRSGLAGLTAAAALAETVDKLTPDRERALSTYTLLLGGLQALTAAGPGSVVPAFLVKLLSLSGYHPQLGVCAGCGASEEMRFFSPVMGGAICDVCRVEERGALHVPADRLRLLAHLLAADFGQPAEPRAVTDVTHVLKRYVEYHLERPLRSLDLLAT
jgi:DNA repair protein RecO (recombination protein O)